MRWYAAIVLRATRPPCTGGFSSSCSSSCGNLSFFRFRLCHEVGFWGRCSTRRPPAVGGITNLSFLACATPLGCCSSSLAELLFRLLGLARRDGGFPGCSGRGARLFLLVPCWPFRSCKKGFILAFMRHGFHYSHLMCWYSCDSICMYDILAQEGFQTDRRGIHK